MKAGLAWIAGGLVVIGIGAYGTLHTKHMITFGAFIIGLLWIGRGVVRILEARKAGRPN